MCERGDPETQNELYACTDSPLYDKSDHTNKLIVINTGRHADTAPAAAGRPEHGAQSKERRTGATPRTQRNACRTSHPGRRPRPKRA